MGGHALVIGGSMAGLLAGRVLADHFERVTIVERDRFPEGPAPRKGVPQARHLHALLARGQVTLEKLFPGFRDELVAAGALVLDMADDVAWLTPAGWGVRFPSDLLMLACSRDLLDWGVRRRMAALSNVRFIEECDVRGLLPSPDGTGVGGVRIRSRGHSDGSGAEEELFADLVVDAAGRGSRAPKWLEALGYDRPQETTIDAHLGYASRIYERPEFRDWGALYVQLAPPEVTRGGVLFPVEGDRWMLTLVGAGHDLPPTDEAGFMEFARSLHTPMLHDAIRDAVPLTPVTGYRATENRLRHYEKLSRWPENLLVVGDAACAFNPVYGQGMTTAALGAEALGESLREQRRRRPEENLGGLGRRFQKRLAKVNSAPWTLATGEDFRVRGVEGGSPDRVTRMMHRYMDRAVSLTTEDSEVRLALLEAFNLSKPPTTLFHPSILARVLRQAITRRRAARKEVTEHALSTPGVVAQQR
jgi:2-polyprenyl-6-methoxyphenol hydroxylase-like FAD-dependent oxidoreductase